MCLGIEFSGLGGKCFGFGWVLSKLFATIMPHFWWQGLLSEIPCKSSLGSIWVVCKLVRECVQGFVFFMSPLSIIFWIFMAHFVQLVPFGQMGENFWGVGHAVKHVKIQNFIVNICQNFIGCN